ncbi:MAG TPA: CCA tRNA nucleotidyltransferase, partial [Magnetospirillaceae bacterium]|nr:CCA tRNA nucleotidyltransferase [Magnetospirillaceae bacterium]
MEGLDDLPKDEPVGELPPQSWMEEEGTQLLIAALSADGAQPRFIGGCVRDSLAHRPVTDIDIATPDQPERVMELLARAGLRAIPTGIDHGTVTALAGGRSFEITTLRRDVETDGRRAKVAFTDDWILDASRRD